MSDSFVVVRRTREYKPLVAAFNPDLHPRGHDGKFIEKFGFIKIVGGYDKGNHGQVVDITPDKSNPGRPVIHYRQTDNRGNQIGPRLGATPDQVESIDEKARLSGPPSARRTEMDVDLGPDTNQSPYGQLNFEAPGQVPRFPVPQPQTTSHDAEIPGIGSVDEYLAANPQQPDEPFFEWQSRLCDGLPQKSRHALTFETRERYPKVDYIAEGSARWRAEHDLPEPKVDLTEVPAPLEKADAVARAFETAADQSDDPRVQAAFAEFKRQNDEMWDFATRPESEGGLGIKVDFWTNLDETQFGVGPYADATAQAEDLRANHHIYLEHGLGGDHGATMTDDEYDRFRAVHDIFGHAGIGGGFDRHGEYQAYLAHSSMYEGDGRRAMASEYHGVNTAVWAGAPGSPGTGKSILLPEELIPNPFGPTGDIIAASAVQVPTPAQQKALGIDAAHAESLVYLAMQANIEPPFAQWYDDLPRHHSTPPEGTEPYAA
jgi:hypothetical protein